MAMKAVNLRQRIDRLAEASGQNEPVNPYEGRSVLDMTVHEAAEFYRICCNQGSRVPVRAFHETRMTPEEAEAAYHKLMD